MADAALEFVDDFFGRLKALVAENHRDAAVQKGKLPQALGKHVKVVGGGFLENALVALPADDRAVLVGVADDFHLCLRHAALVLLVVDMPVAVNGRLKPVGKRVHAGDAYAVQAARDLVASLVELAARVQARKDKLQRAHFLRRVDVNRNAAPIVLHAADVVFFERHGHGVAEARHGFVDAVVHDLVHKVVQAVRPRRADVHARALADCLQSFQNLYVSC